MEMRKKFYGFALLIVFISSCSVKLVAPYDEKLVAQTEAFYKNAAAMIDKGIAVSPIDNSSNVIVSTEQQDGHYKKFEGDYNRLISEAEALVLRALVKADEIDSLGKKLQGNIEAAIETTIPSECKEIASDVGAVSLKVKNYLDLKCIISNWKEQHASQEVTQNSLVLKRSVWSARKKTIFAAVLFIIKSEEFKRS